MLDYNDLKSLVEEPPLILKCPEPNCDSEFKEIQRDISIVRKAGEKGKKDFTIYDSCITIECSCCTRRDIASRRTFIHDYK